jgi:nucleotide-binding universal stress UspA family protein
MYTHILIPTDGSALANKAITQGMALAREMKAKITVVTVTVPFHVMSLDPTVIEDTREEYGARVRARASRILASVLESAERAGVPCETVQVEHEHPYVAIIDTAELKHCDLIMMASHGYRGVTALLLGSETVKVLTHSKLPVLVHR